MMDYILMSMITIKDRISVESPTKASKDPIIPEYTTTTPTNNLPVCPLVKESENLTEENLAQKQAELDLMWDKIQELRQTDEFAAQVMYEKYRAMSGEIPPAIPTSFVVEDQAVS